MPDSKSTPPSSGEGRKFTWMPVLDGYILRSFLVPFGILLFAFTLLFIIMDMYNEIGDFLDNKAPLSVCVRFFTLKIPGNIRFILPITVLLACMYALANLGRNRELTAIRASGISLVRSGLPIFTIGFCVMLVNFYFNERLVPETTRQAEIVKELLENPDYVEQTNARLQYRSGDQRRQWYFGQFNDDGFQENVKLKILIQHNESKQFAEKNGKKDILWPKLLVEAQKTRYIPGENDEPGFWEFINQKINEYPEDRAGVQTGIIDLKPILLKDLIEVFAKLGFKIEGVITTKEIPKSALTATEPKKKDAPAEPPEEEKIADPEETVSVLALTLLPSEKYNPGIVIQSKDVRQSLDELMEEPVDIFTSLSFSESIIPDKPSVIIKSVVEPDALSSIEIYRILRDNPKMARNLRCIYSTILFNRLAFPWACFLCAFFALPLATRNERSGIFSAIALAVGIAVLYQVLNEIFMVIGKNGYLSFDIVTNLLHFDPGPVVAGLAPTFIFGGYGVYLLKKSG